jgi:hypothetical protein
MTYWDDLSTDRPHMAHCQPVVQMVNIAMVVVPILRGRTSQTYIPVRQLG